MKKLLFTLTLGVATAGAFAQMSVLDENHSQFGANRVKTPVVSVNPDVRAIQPYAFRDSTGRLDVRIPDSAKRRLTPEQLKLAVETEAHVNRNIELGVWRLNADGSLTLLEQKYAAAWGIEGWGNYRPFWWGWEYHMDSRRTGWVVDRLMASDEYSIRRMMSGIGHPWTADVMLNPWHKWAYIWAMGRLNYGRGVYLTCPWTIYAPAVGRR